MRRSAADTPNVTVRTPRARAASDAATPSRITASSSIRKPSAAQSALVRSAERDRIRELEGLLRKREQSARNERTETGRLQQTEHRLFSTSEELQATLAELDELRTRCLVAEKRAVDAEEAADRLRDENADYRQQLVHSRESTARRRSRSARRALTEEKENVDVNSPMSRLCVREEKEKEEEEMEKEMEQLREQLAMLKKEKTEWESSMTREREETRQLLRDFHTAVKVAEAMKEEALDELNKWRQSTTSSTPSNDDKEACLMWAELVRQAGGGSKRNALMKWTRDRLAGYDWIEVSNFSASWSDGSAMCCLLHSFRPDLAELRLLRLPAGPLSGRAVAMAQSMHLPLVRPALFATPTPDWNEVMAAVLSVYKKCVWDEK